MPSFSQVNLMGYIGNDVELKSGRKVNYVQLSVAVTKVFKRATPDPESGKKWKTRTRWMKVMLFAGYADYASKRLKKGDLVYITGELDISEWKSRDGTKRAEMYVLGSYVLNMNPDLLKIKDDNYGVDESEMENDGIPF